MDRREQTDKEKQVRDRLRHAERGAVYVRRPTPPPARQIVDVFKVRPAEPPIQTRPASLAIVRPVPAIASRPGVKTSQAARPQPKSPPKTKSKRRRFLQPAVLYVTAAMLIVFGGWLAYNGLVANKRVSEQVQRLSDKAEAADGSSEGNPPSITPPTSEAVKNYSVAPNLPKYIDIPSLSVHARILSMGVDSKNTLQAPGNVYDAGWYNASAQPGQTGGMLIDGHISSWSTKGVFYGLNQLKTGDTITVTRGDNRQFTYKVVTSQTKPVDQVDMGSLLVSPDSNKPGLSLISCSGEVIPGTNEYDKRIMIQAVLVN